MVRKQKTNKSGSQYSQPVRFYKIVALSFLCITILLLGLIVFMSAKRATITITTRPEPIERTVQVFVGKTNEEPGISGLVTSTAVNVKKEFQSKGVREETGTAKGVVTIFNERGVDQPLVATTRLLTPDGVLFRLKNRVLVPAGGSIQAEVYADQEGSASNIGPSEFTIPGLSEALQKLVYAKSDQSMTGGIAYVGILEKNDLELAEQQMLADLKAAGEERLQSAYEGMTGVYIVAEKSITSDTELGQENDGFALSGTATIVGVFYSADDMNELVRNLLAKQALNMSEVAQPSDNGPSAVLSEYDIENGTAVLAVNYSGIVTIDPNSKELEKLIFYGKTADEVRRYVLSLDHVHGVDVSFRPLWNTTVPHVADHVNVIVRQVE